MITSKDNRLIKYCMQLHQKKYRKQAGQFLVEGEHLVAEAKKSGCLDKVLVCETYAYKEQGTVVSKPIFDKIAKTCHSAGILAICHVPVLTRGGNYDANTSVPVTVGGTNQMYNIWNHRSRRAEEKRILMVDDVQDPGNLGTLIRSALAFGFDAVALSENTVDVYNDKVVRATQGALFYLPIFYINLEKYLIALQAKGVMVYATGFLENSILMNDCPQQAQMAFIVGNEAAGVSETLLKGANKVMTIPMSSDVESLNVGVAGSIMMQHFNGL